MKLLKIILLFMALCLVVPVGAKKYKFDIDSQRNVVVKRSGSPGQKIVEVVAIAGSVDKAISQALVDAVAALTFEGPRVVARWVPARLFWQKASLHTRRTRAFLMISSSMAVSCVLCAV